MRWSLKLLELDFVVEHRAGTKIPHVDALSRHVGTIVDKSKLSPEEIRSEQEKDHFCRQLSPGSCHSKTEFFYDEVSLI
jgi:hypothetical protein